MRSANNPNKPMSIQPASVSELDEMIELIQSFVQLDEWSATFKLDDKEKEQLKYILQQEYGGSLPGKDKPSQFNQMILKGAKFVKQTRRYCQLKEQHYRHIAASQLQHLGIPLSQFPQLTRELQPEQLTPADCAALKDWPNGRLPANGHSGRLENAGQFVQRLLDQKLYDPATYGRLYLHDLRRINPKLYLALSQWQNRTGQHILENKRAKLEDLEQRVMANDNSLSYLDKARVANARWRRRRSAS